MGLLRALFVAVCEIDGGGAVVMVDEVEEGCGDEGCCKRWGGFPKKPTRPDVIRRPLALAK